MPLNPVRETSASRLHALDSSLRAVLLDLMLVGEWPLSVCEGIRVFTGVPTEEADRPQLAAVLRWASDQGQCCSEVPAVVLLDLRVC